MNITRNIFIQSILALLIVVGFFMVIFIPMFYPEYALDEALKQTLVTVFILVVSYYFGSSQGSQKKDEVILAQANNLDQQQPQQVTVDTSKTGPIEVKETK